MLSCPNKQRSTSNITWVKAQLAELVERDSNPGPLDYALTIRPSCLPAGEGFKTNQTAKLKKNLKNFIITRRTCSPGNMLLSPASLTVQAQDSVRLQIEDNCKRRSSDKRNEYQKKNCVNWNMCHSTKLLTQLPLDSSVQHTGHYWPLPPR